MVCLLVDVGHFKQVKCYIFNLSYLLQICHVHASCIKPGMNHKRTHPIYCGSNTCDTWVQFTFKTTYLNGCNNSIL